MVAAPTAKAGEYPCFFFGSYTPEYSYTSNLDGSCVSVGTQALYISDWVFDKTDWFWVGGGPGAPLMARAYVFSGQTIYGSNSAGSGSS